jgi:hypothetical protein
MKTFEIIQEKGFLAGANDCLIIKFVGGENEISFSSAVELIQKQYPNANPQLTSWQDEQGYKDQNGEYLFFE